MGGYGCNQGWGFILAILLLKFSYQKVFPFILTDFDLVGDILQLYNP
jgi:hypothetical protein